MLRGHYRHVVTYGERFRALRVKLWKAKGKTVLALANELDSPYAATVYNIERQWRVPLLPTLTKHAAALGCRPWDLLVNVETEYDLVRELADVRPDEAERRWLALLQRYQKSAVRTSKRAHTSATEKRYASGKGGRPVSRRT